MKTHSTCCGGTTTPCDSAIAEVPRYYPRQLITPDDLTLEQDYFRDRMRRHNRLLHGWGVVCGAVVCPASTTHTNGVVALNPWEVVVQPGYVLGPYGDEIVLDCKRTVDLRTTGVTGVTGEPCMDVPDPWCSQVTVPRTTGTLWVAIKYLRSMTRPVRVQPIGCGCDDNTCECSRWHDGYQIGILTCCPDAKEIPPKGDDLFKGDVPSCPDCPPQPWVVLAAVQVDADGNVTSINNCDCRRLVASFGGFWWPCSQSNTTVTGPKPATQVEAGKTTTVTVTGTNLDPKATYTVGDAISVKVNATSSAPPTSIALDVTPDANASTGPRTLIVVNSDCSTVTFADAIEVTAPAAKTAPTPGPKPPAPAAKAAARPPKKGGDTPKG
jgi:hypothetical protein